MIVDNIQTMEVDLHKLDFNPDRFKVYQDEEEIDESTIQIRSAIKMMDRYKKKIADRDAKIEEQDQKIYDLKGELLETKRIANSHMREKIRLEHKLKQQDEIINNLNRLIRQTVKETLKQVNNEDDLK